MDKTKFEYVDSMITTSGSGYDNTQTGVDYDFKPPFYTSKIQGDAISTIDGGDKIKMGHNNIHIQPANNGFIVTMKTRPDGIKTYCFSNFEDVVKFVDDLTLMDLDSERVADNV